MADRKQLEDALVAAHNAGDTEAASIIADEIKGLSASIQQTNQSRTIGEDLTRGASMVARGLAAPTIGAVGGGLVGGPAGALAGSLAVPAGDIVASGLNALLPEQYEVGYPSTAVQNLLTKAGLPEPESMLERALVTGGSALGGTAGQLSGLSRLAQTATSPVGRNIAEQLSQAPARQIAASLPAGTVGQLTTEATGSPIAGTIASAVTAVPFALGAKTPSPTVEQVKQAAKEQYDVAKLSGLEFKNNAFKKNAIDIQKTLIAEGFDKDLHPSVNAAINRLVKDGTPKTLQNVETLRKIAKAPASSINADERRLAQIMVDKFDNFVENAQPNQLVSKKDFNATSVLKDARKLYSQAKKGELLDDIFNSAELRAEANFSQSGMENALRRRLVNLADNKKLMRTFTPDERKAITDAAKGGSIQNALRFVGKLAPTGIVSGGGSVGLGYLAGGPTGAIAAPLIGSAARYGAEKIGLRNFENLQRQLLTGQQPTTTGLSPAGAVMTRGLLYPYNEEQ